ncbi:hypothetical protein ACET8S_15545 [Aeromonas veronii]|uniref:hypothetical protein n=1 Tax=Aeromonas TaxID=642 RepID=UPI0011168C1B|nr:MULTISPECIES: hypothetical protein [Aeromonas]MBL0626760.1 hypothetical protein [Aeromonas jandaei]MBL0637744.1 hypothetical protein [Aeromonas veronii]MCJ8219016.1 hypothetical protein [Aeromonas veronii]WAG06630.1 hypothetical protein NRZ30_16410 [Aeromonas jandaei]
MDVIKALEIISALSEGVNPETGEELSEESCFNQPKVIRALFIAKQSLEASIISEKRKSDLPENAGKPWKPDEDELLANSFDSGLGVDELSRIHKRTKGSIASRLVRLGKINERADIYTR